MRTILLPALLLCSTLLAQNNRVIYENDQIRVVVVSYAGGQKSAMADHTPAVAVALTDRKERLTMRSGPARDLDAKAGALWPVDGAFATENLGDKSETLVVEFKTPSSMQAAGSSLQELAKPRPAANEASAVARMRTLNTAELTFAATYNQGFTDGLNRMGPPPAGQELSQDRGDLLQPWLAGLTEGGTNLVVVRNGYRTTYNPGPGPYGKIATYTITSQPVEFGVTGFRNFFTDQTAVIRATDQNRLATANDPPI